MTSRDAAVPFPALRHSERANPQLKRNFGSYIVIIRPTGHIYPSYLMHYGSSLPTFGIKKGQNLREDEKHIAERVDSPHDESRNIDNVQARRHIPDIFEDFM